MTTLDSFQLQASSNIFKMLKTKNIVRRNGLAIKMLITQPHDLSLFLGPLLLKEKPGSYKMSSDLQSSNMGT